MPLAAIDDIGRWMGQVAKELSHDSGVAALMQRCTDKGLGLSGLLQHIPNYTQAMEFFESVRTCKGKPIPEGILGRLPQIRIERGRPRPELKNLAGIQYRHGVYIHYMVKMVDGVAKVVVYVGKGAAGKDCLSLAQGEKKTASDVGLRKRVQQHLQEMASAMAGRKGLSTVLHATEMLHADRADEGEVVDERWIFPFALYSKQALDLIFQMNTSDTLAVMDLYRFHKGTGNAAARNYGVDHETFGLLDALFLVLEQFTLIAIGQPLGPPPLMLSESKVSGRYEDRWSTAPYWTEAKDLYSRWKRLLSDTTSGVVYTNMATPLLDKSFGRLYGKFQDGFEAQYESMRQFSPGLAIIQALSQVALDFQPLPPNSSEA